MADLVLPPINISTLTPKPPELADLTTVKLDGSGAFDVLMRATKLHLQEEFDQNRIVGKEYATVYLGALTAVLQQAVAYLSTSVQADLVQGQLGLIRQQIVTELSKTGDTIPPGLGFNSTTTMDGMVELEKQQVAANILKLEADTANQIKVTDSQVDVNDAQITKMGKDSTDQYNKVTAEVDLMEGQEAKLITDAEDQRTKITKEGELTDQQVLKLQADIPDQHAKIMAEVDLSVQQLDKIKGEILLLGQKTISELAVTSDTVYPHTPKLSTLLTGNPWLNPTGTLGGTSQQKNALFSAQTEGFARDAEQKIAKIMIDTWSVRTGAGLLPLVKYAGLGEDDIFHVLDEVRANAGLPKSAGQGGGTPPVDP